MKLKPFQKQDYARLALVPGAILAHEPGLGKTWAAIVWALLKTGYDVTGSDRVPLDSTRVSRVLTSSPQPTPSNEGAGELCQCPPEAGATRRDATHISPRAAVLLVVPGDLHKQFSEEARNVFRCQVTPLDSQATFLRLSTLARDGRRALPPGFYITSYTQLGSNGVGARGSDVSARETQALPEDDPCENVGKFGHQVQRAGHKTGRNPHIRCISSPSLADLCGDSFAAVAVDEGTKIKGGLHTHIATGVLQMNAPARLVLTATPIKNRFPDLFALAWWACGGNLEATPRFPYSLDDKLAFASTFCVAERNLTAAAKLGIRAGARGSSARTSRFTKLTPQVCNIHRAWKLNAPIILRRRKKDIGEQIVAKQRHLIRVPMGTRQAARYKEILEARFVDKNGLPATGAKLQALRQCAANGLPKLFAALKLFDQILRRGEQVVLFSPFHDPLDQIEARLREAGLKWFKLDGRTSQTQRGLLAALFKGSTRVPRVLTSSPQPAHFIEGAGELCQDPRDAGATPILLAGIDCMAEGHSFHRCNNAIQFSYPWALDKVLQAEDRVHRLNSEKPVNAYRLICEGSIDRKMESQIDEKSDAAEMMLDGHLLGENAAELNLSELLDVAAKEFNEQTRTLDEEALLAEWPALRESLRQAFAMWGNTRLPGSARVSRALTSSPKPTHSIEDAGELCQCPRDAGATQAEAGAPRTATTDSTKPAPVPQLAFAPPPPLNWRERYRRRITSSLSVAAVRVATASRGVAPASRGH